MAKTKMTAMEKSEALIDKRLKGLIDDENTHFDISICMKLLLSGYARFLLNQADSKNIKIYLSDLESTFSKFFETLKMYEAEIDIVELFSIMILVLNKYSNDLENENQNKMSEREQMLRHLAHIKPLVEFCEEVDREIDLYRRVPKYPETLQLREEQKNAKKQIV